MTYENAYCMLQTFENINSKFPIKIDFKTKSFTMYTTVSTMSIPVQKMQYAYLTI